MAKIAATNLTNGLDQIERLARILRSLRHESDLNPAQWESLRYLSRCNSISNSPTALTRYLSATKGTVSQTLITLKQKGLIEKTVRKNERRSVVLRLTRAGREKLEQDPWNRVSANLNAMKNKPRRQLIRAVDTLLTVELKRSGARAFGTCNGCRYFRKKGNTSGKGGAHLCLLLEMPLRSKHIDAICAEYEPL